MGFSLLVAGSDFREDELECEQAIAHLVDCCPAFPPDSVHCTFAEGCGSLTETALSISESQCIEAQSCDEVRLKGLCEKVNGLAQPEFDEDDAGALHPTDGGHAPVCP